jgi:hypothetical protein
VVKRSRAASPLRDDANAAEREDRVMRRKVDDLRKLAIATAALEAARWGESSVLESCAACQAVTLHDLRLLEANKRHEFDTPLSDGRTGFWYRLLLRRCRECFVRRRADEIVATPVLPIDKSS